MRKRKPAPKPKVKDYWVLALSKGKTRLLKLSDDKLTEVNDKNFPEKYEEQFQYERKTGPKVQYYDDESRINEIRLHAYFRHIDHLLSLYLKRADLPVILLSVKNHISDFKHVASAARKITYTIRGNYDYHSVHELKLAVMRKLKSGVGRKK